MTVSANQIRDQGFLVAIPATVDPPGGIEGAKWATFLSYLALLTSLTPERRNQGHWINIHNQVLRSQLGREYKRTIDQLRDSAIIEVNGAYSTGWNGNPAFTKSYRLASRHRHGRSKLFPIKYPCAARRAGKVYEIDADNLGPAGMHYLWAFEQFSIDAGSAAADRRLQNHWHQWAISRFANRQEFARRCEYRRYHCLMTQLPREARPYLSVDGQGVSIADVSACQPLLLGMLTTTRPQHNGHTTSSLLPYDARFSLWRRRAARDVQHWLGLCESGRIYQFMYDEVARQPVPAMATLTTRSGHKLRIDLRKLSPKAFKRTSLIPVFDRLSRMLTNPVFKVIQARFPTLASWLIEAKRDRHQHVACLLQRAESELMIDRVGNELRKRFPDEPIQPIHDALIVRDEFHESAVALIREQFGKVGLHPRIK